MGKNLEKVQSMVDGTFTRKLQVGYTGKTLAQRKEGEIWEEKDKQWTKVDGKRQQITKIPARGFDKCTSCKKLILKDQDQDVYNRYQRCYYCQIDFECELKEQGMDNMNNDAYRAWVDKQQKTRWDAIEKEVVEILKEMAEEQSLFNTDIANAMANENVSMTIKNTKGS